MAEAHAIASLSTSLPRGVHLTLDDEGFHLHAAVTIPPPREALRQFVFWLRHVRQNLAYRFWPVGPLAFATFTTVIVAWVVCSPPDAWVRSGWLASAVWEISLWMPWIPGSSVAFRVGVLAVWVSLAFLLLFASGQQALLRVLLSDKSFLYQARSPTALLKAWFVAVRCLTRGKPHIYSFQRALPHLPVPPLAETVRRYLESAKQLQTPEEFEGTAATAAAFLAKEGPTLQWYLQLKSWFFDNYVTDWWEQYVYLKGRSPIAVNSNYYVLDSGRWTPTPVQEARAAVVVFGMMQYLERLEDGDIPPVMIGDSVIPLCMWQHERIFATCRVPGRACDEVKHWDTAHVRHIAVYCRGSYYRVTMWRRDGSLRQPLELEGIFAAIKADAARRTPSVAEACIPALTGDNRTRWAEVREAYFSDGVNRRTLTMIESALVYVVLSDDTFDMLDWTGRGKRMLAGDRERPDLWFDKSVCLVIFADGKCSLNCEHSWADAPTAGHLFEVAMIVGEYNLGAYDDSGHTKALPAAAGGEGRRCSRPVSSSGDTPWARLPWALTRDAEAAIDASRGALGALSDDLDLQIVSFSQYGKDFVKRCKVSPDAYVQMAMQLAYFRDQGRFDATYESTMTRLFLHGRTETVRPVTAESCAFVRAMLDAGASPTDKLRALQASAKRHVLSFSDAMAGRGIDRHLFALYVVSVGRAVDSPFLKAALSVPWRLSTSQQPQQQTALWDIKDPANAKRVSPGGGFGPVSEDGYGVSYMVSGERELFFHVSSKRACPRTDSARLVRHIFEALVEMKGVLSLAIAAEGGKGAGAAAASKAE